MFWDFFTFRQENLGKINSEEKKEKRWAQYLFNCNLSVDVIWAGSLHFLCVKEDSEETEENSIAYTGRER